MTVLGGRKESEVELLNFSLKLNNWAARSTTCKLIDTLLHDYFLALKKKKIISSTGKE
jgi:hypothetical protein